MDLEKLDKLNKLRKEIENHRYIVDKIILFTEEIKKHPSEFTVEISACTSRIKRKIIDPYISMPLNEEIINSLEQRLVIEENKLNDMLDEFRNS